MKAPPLTDPEDGPMVDQVTRATEDFMDSFATRFLHRFADGAFDRYAALIFARDDVAGLAAYQYALELRRQGLVPARGPQLHLWNLLHTGSAPAMRFNRTELDRLIAMLSAVLGARLDLDRLAAALAAEERRAVALAALPPGGETAFVARNAGRWMTPEDHVARLEPPAREGADRRIALVGTACDIPVLHRLCAEFGTIVADLQDYGRIVPQPRTGEPLDMLRRIAGDPLCLRAAPPARFTRALREGTGDADLVIATVNRNDDALGWELPGLRMQVESRGGRFIDLGFLPFRPDAAWIDGARARVAEALS
ncbi:hypothetical protein [Citreimonas salinaria]|uniref:hypothetical protein n=1 Tax=Citreimonas salinaria TaxID=321339 RepID=UPI00115FED5F|nr:hypothetical protein [Citreimonas salinaria]